MHGDEDVHHCPLRRAKTVAGASSRGAGRGLPEGVCLHTTVRDAHGLGRVGRVVSPPDASMYGARSLGTDAQGHRAAGLCRTALMGVSALYRDACLPPPALLGRSTRMGSTHGGLRIEE